MPSAKCHAEKREFEIENVKCRGKIEREKKRIRNAVEEKISGSKGTNKKIFSREIKYRFQTKNMGHHG